MEERIDNILKSLGAAYKMIQDLTIQSTASNVSNIKNSLDALKFGFEEIQAVWNELKGKKENEPDE